MFCASPGMGTKHSSVLLGARSAPQQMGCELYGLLYRAHKLCNTGLQSKAWSVLAIHDWHLLSCSASIEERMRESRHKARCKRRPLES